MQRNKDGSINDWKCPKCGNTVNDYPALSRLDNKTDICYKCSQAEAMLDYKQHLAKQAGVDPGILRLEKVLEAHWIGKIYDKADPLNGLKRIGVI